MTSFIIKYYYMHARALSHTQGKSIEFEIHVMSDLENAIKQPQLASHKASDHLFQITAFKLPN